jgi:CubicO group peptidase (beta-lactamase class C family)
VRSGFATGGIEIPEARIDSIFARFAAPGSPGCVATVMRAGEIVFTRGYGVANRETGEPLTAQTVIDGGSLTKQFTAFAVAMLAAEGRLSLDDDIRTHIPELPAYPHTVTLRHLLNHASGIREYTELPALAADGSTGTGLLLRADGLSFAPGERYVYSNSGFLLLGRVVERVSGQPIAAFLRERIFQPLGMEHTWLPADTADLRGRAHAYIRADTGWVHQNPPAEVAQGDFGVLTTPADLARWDRNLYNGRVGGAALRLMQRDSLRMNDGTLSTYAFGQHLEPYRGLRRVWHGGSRTGSARSGGAFRTSASPFSPPATCARSRTGSRSAWRTRCSAPCSGRRGGRCRRRRGSTARRRRDTSASTSAGRRTRPASCSGGTGGSPRATWRRGTTWCPSARAAFACAACPRSSPFARRRTGP